MKRRFIVLLVVSMASVAHADLKCGGTEPFWSLVISDNKATYENMGEGLKMPFDAVLLQDAQGLKPGHVRKYLLKNAKTTSEVMVLKKKCDDGMSDITYPYTIRLRLPMAELYLRDVDATYHRNLRFFFCNSPSSCTSFDSPIRRMAL